MRPCSLRTGPGRLHRFDQDKLSELFADCQPRITDLTNEIGLAGEQFDDVVLAKTELAQAILNFRGRAQLFDADGDASLDST